MDLFYSSGLLSGTAISSALLETLDDQPQGQADNEHNNFIRFLQVASAIDVPVLPLVWEPAFDILGRDGATSRVNQAPLNARFTFAFKRFNPKVTKPDISQKAFRQIQYNAAIAEMTILNRKEVRQHQNIITFFGVCFEFSSVSDEVWPVLSFNKATLGDLHAFLSGRDPFAVTHLAAICGEVAKGIEFLHRQGVIHGDIKPTNVLVNQDPGDPTAGLTVTVADFGFSGFEPGLGSGSVKMARTEPWEAPEWHPRYITLGDAKKMDLYSFGLLCLWILFRGQHFPQLVDPSVTVEEAMLSGDVKTTARVQALKKDDDSVLKSALKLLEEAADMDEQDHARLKQALMLTLSSSPADRAQSMVELVELLGVPEEEGEDDREMEHTAPMVVPNWHGTFQIEKIFFHLEMSDYRVHSYIADALKDTANGAGCLACQNNAAFQLGLCYAIAFGVSYNDTERDTWILKSGKSLGDLQEALNRIRTENRRANFAAGLYKMGYRSDLLDRYRNEELLPKATTKYRAMVTRREELFGSSHFSTLRLKSFLVDLLSSLGEFDEALTYALSNLRNASPEIGIRDLLSLKGQVAHIYENTNRRAEAEALRHEIVQGYDDDPNDKNHPSRIYDRVQLARLLLENGRVAQALELSTEAEQDAVLLLGMFHDTSRSAKRVIIDALDTDGQIEQALEIHEELIRTLEQCLKADHGVLIEDLAILGVQYYRVDRLDSAKGCYNRVMALVALKPENAIPAIISINNYATGLLSRGNIQESTTILQHLLNEAKRVLGPDQDDVMAITGNLAAAYKKQKKWSEVEPLERQVLKYRHRTLGTKHSYTLSAYGNLARTLMHQRRWADAATTFHQELEIRDSMLETTNAIRITLLSNLGKALTLSEAYTEAVRFFGRLFPLIEQQRGVLQESNDERAPSTHIQDIALAALCQVKIGDRQRARQQISILLNGLQSPWREIPNVIIDHLTYVAMACEEHNWDEEPEQVLAAAALVMDKYQRYLNVRVIDKLVEVTHAFLERRGKSELHFNPGILEAIDAVDLE